MIKNSPVVSMLKRFIWDLIPFVVDSKASSTTVRFDQGWLNIKNATIFIKEQIAAKALKDSLILAPLSLSDAQISRQLKTESSSTSSSTTGSTLETQIYSPDSGKEKLDLLSGKSESKKDDSNDVNRRGIDFFTNWFGTTVKTKNLASGP